MAQNNATLIRKALRHLPGIAVKTTLGGRILISWEDGASEMTVSRLASAAAPNVYVELRRDESRKLKQHAVDVVNYYYDGSATLDRDGNILAEDQMATPELTLYRAILTLMASIDGDLFALDSANPTRLWVEMAVAAWRESVEEAEIAAWGQYVERETGITLLNADAIQSWIEYAELASAEGYAATADSPAQVRSFVLAWEAAQRERRALMQAASSLQVLGKLLPNMTRSQVEEALTEHSRAAEVTIRYFTSEGEQVLRGGQRVSLEQESPPQGERIQRPTEPISITFNPLPDPVRDLIRGLDLSKADREGDEALAILEVLKQMVQEEDAHG